MYSTEDPQSMIWGNKFLAEAKQRWAQQRDQQPLLSIASGYILSLALACYCSDSLSGSFMEQSTRMAIELRLFGATKSEDEIREDERMSPLLYRATAHVEWGAYSWLALMAHYYGTPVSISTPTFRIPGDRGDARRSDGTASSSLPPYMGQTFTALCQLRLIHTMATVAYNTRGEQAPLKRVSLQFAEDIYQEMLEWADKLGDAQIRGEHASDHVLILQ